MKKRIVSLLLAAAMLVLLAAARLCGGRARLYLCGPG